MIPQLNPAASNNEGRRRRLAMACQQCRRRKIKCDLGAPKCAYCAKTKLVCVRMEQRVESGRHPYIAKYVESMEAELRRLKDRATALHLDVSASASQVSGSPYAETQPPQEQMLPDDGADATYLTPLISRAENTVDRDDTGELPRDDNNAGSIHVKYMFKIDQMVRSVVSMDGTYPSKSGSSNLLLADAVSGSHAVKLTEIATMYLDNYFDRIGAYLPFLDRRLYDRLINEALQSREREVDNISSPHLLMVLALGARIHSLTDQRAVFHSSVYLMRSFELLSRTTAVDSIELLHLILLLTIYSLFSPHGGSTWHFLGLAMQTCVRLGLHQRVTLQNTDSEREDNMAFWSTYVLERCIALTLGRPFCIADAEISVQPPVLEAGSNNISALSNLARLASQASSRMPPSDETLTRIRSHASTLLASTSVPSALQQNYPATSLFGASLTISFLIQITGHPTYRPDSPPSEIIPEDARRAVRLGSQYLRRSHPMPWFLGHAIFHSILAFALIFRMKSHLRGSASSSSSSRAATTTGLNLEAAQIEENFEDILITADTVLRVGCASFNELSELGDLLCDLIKKRIFSDELVRRLNDIANPHTRKLARSILVLSMEE